MVETLSGGFFEHWFGWRFEGEEDADGCVFSFDDVADDAVGRNTTGRECARLVTGRRGGTLVLLVFPPFASVSDAEACALARA